jgi:Phage integrase family
MNTIGELSVRKQPILELPPYVRRVVAKAREYFYFQRHRGTKVAGPRIALPSDLHSVAFWQAYRAALGTDEPTGRTFNDLITAYKISPEFLHRAQATQEDYSRYLKIIGDAWGPLLVSGLRPKNVLTLRDAWAATPVAANHLLSVMKTLINWGIPREFSDSNPCTAIAKLEGDEGGARPWPLWAFDLIESHAREDMRRAVWLARYTGQRQADVIRMSKRDLEDGGINVVQQKTGKELWIPLHEDLKAEMETWEVGPPWFFVQTPKNEGYDTMRFRAAWTRLMATPAGRIRREGFTFHGLRASSVENLRGAGCDDPSIESVTGMSQAMIRRYSRFANQKKLAKAAIQRLERTGRER